MPLAPSLLRPAYCFPLTKFAIISIHYRGRRSAACAPTRAVEGNETEFQVDRERAREALEKLDRQLQSLSLEGTIRKSKPPDPISDSVAAPYSDSSADKRAVEMPEIPASFLAYSAIVLLALTFINNLIFIIFIKPYVDGNEDPQTILGETLSNPTTQAPPIAPPLADRQ